MWGVALVAAASGLVAAILPPPMSEPEFLLPLFVGVISCYAAVGALVGTRQPRNPIGRLLLGTGASLGLSLAPSSS